MHLETLGFSGFRVLELVFLCASYKCQIKDTHSLQLTQNRKVQEIIFSSSFKKKEGHSLGSPRLVLEF